MFLTIIVLSVDEIQVAAYKILGSLYTLGIDPSLHRDRKYLKTEIDRHRPALGNCLGAYSSTFPVAFLEPHLNKHNMYSLLNRIADHSLEAQGGSFSVVSKSVFLSSVSFPSGIWCCELWVCIGSWSLKLRTIVTW